MNTQPMGLAVISGASSGIGAIYADRLARCGYDLLLVARNRERMGDLAKKLAVETGRKIEILAADLTDSNDLVRLERILREDQRVTLLVNNAGMASTASLLNSDVAEMICGRTMAGLRSRASGAAPQLVSREASGQIRIVRKVG